MIFYNLFKWFNDSMYTAYSGIPPAFIIHHILIHIHQKGTDDPNPNLNTNAKTEYLYMDTDTTKMCESSLWIPAPFVPARVAIPFFRWCSDYNYQLFLSLFLLLTLNWNKNKLKQKQWFLRTKAKQRLMKDLKYKLYRTGSNQKQQTKALVK